ncbi:MAG: type IV secretion protein IcmD [Legionella sp.]|nr:type IV secretion protein IcmD [Legionella sp.]
MFSSVALAATDLTLGGMASSITDSFASLTKLITAASYLAGLGFSIGAIMKFKQHKDNPTQIPIGTPIALVFISAALLFLPSILDVAGATMFGGSGGQVAGPEGIQYGS